MKNKTLIIILLCISTTLLSAQNIDDILAMVIQNNTTLKASRQIVDAEKIGHRTGLTPNNPDLEFDVNINTDLVYSLLSRAQQEYVVQHFLMGDNIVDNINAIRRNSGVLRNLIKRTEASVTVTPNKDFGYSAVFDNTDYWLFLSGTLSHPGLPVNSRGYSGMPTDTVDYNSTSWMWPKVELDLINHYDLQKKVRTINNEPIYKYVPIVLEGSNGFVFYLDKEKFVGIGAANVGSIKFDIIYLATPTNIDGDTVDTTPQAGQNAQSLSVSTHNDIVKLAVDIFLKEYKYLLGSIKQNNNG